MLDPYHVLVLLHKQQILRQAPYEMMSSSFPSMAAQSRRASLRSSNDVHKQSDSDHSANKYELERDHRKKALHNRVELALVEFGFEEAAKIHAAFTGEKMTITLVPQTSLPHRRRDRAGATLP